MTKLRQLKYWLGGVIKSILTLIMYQKDSFLEHYHGPDYVAALQSYDNALRSKTKWGDEEGSYEKARDMLWEEMGERGLRIWD